VIAHGSWCASVPCLGKGSLTVVYAADPEGNIIELQAWG
jgi:hypothetical protein